MLIRTFLIFFLGLQIFVSVIGSAQFDIESSFDYQDLSKDSKKLENNDVSKGIRANANVKSLKTTSTDEQKKAENNRQLNNSTVIKEGSKISSLPTVLPNLKLKETVSNKFAINITKFPVLFIHKFGTLHNLISQKHWIAIQSILHKKIPLRSKHFEVTKILKDEVKFNPSQIKIFWNDFFDYHVMKKVLMLHNKIRQTFGEKSIENVGIYDVDLSIPTKIKLLNAQIKRILPTKDYEIYLQTQSKLFEVSKDEKEALLL